MRSLSAYLKLGAGLLVAGGIAAPAFYVIGGSVPLTALGLSAILLGFVALLLARSVPQLPPRAAEALLQAGLENLGGLLEELGLEGRAVYVPSSLGGGKPQALIPLHHNAAAPAIGAPVEGRLIVTYGRGPEDVGILVSTPGTAAFQFLDEPPGESSAELEWGLTKILVGALDAVRAVQVSRDGNDFTVRLQGPRLDHGDLKLAGVIGSPLASIAAAVIAEGTRAPVMIAGEERSGGALTVRVALLA